MLEELKKNIRDFGRPPKFIRIDQLLMTLMYFLWNQRISSMQDDKKNEGTMIESKIFHLPGGKTVSCRSDLKSVLIDTSEQPVEYPKKAD